MAMSATRAMPATMAPSGIHVTAGPVTHRGLGGDMAAGWGLVQVCGALFGVGCGPLLVF